MKKRRAAITLAAVLIMIFALCTSAEAASQGHMYYLSDMNTYEEGYDGVLRQNVGWGSYGRDINPDGGTISLNVKDEGRVYFTKGIGAHAPADLIYDLGDSETYQKFSGYFGVDASRNGNGWASISVYVSNNYTTFDTLLLDTGGMKGTTVVEKKTLDITGYRYIRIVCSDLNGNAADHTVIGDAKVYSDDYVASENDETVSHYSEYKQVIDDALTGGTTFSGLLDNETTKSALMNRMLLEKFGSGESGYDNIVNGFMNGKKGERHRAVIEWLLNDPDALEELLAGGDPDSGTYAQALDTLSLLYAEYGEDIKSEEPLFVGTGDDPTRTRGDVYRTMMFSIALSGNVYSWLNNSNPIDPLEKYESYHSVYLDETNHLRYDIFENLCVEEMRHVMNIRVWNDELYWLNAYSRVKTNNVTTTSSTYPNVYSPHRHLRYGKDWDYSGKGYLTQEGFDKVNEKYMLSQYGMSASSVPKLWMVFEGSHICWGISYVGTNFCAAFGVPSHYVLQPGHAAFFVMNRDTNGNITWGIDNNISGWTQTTLSSDTVGRGNSRMICDWGTYSKGWVSYWQGSYILLSQYALDHEDDYVKAELLMSLASYAETVEEKESLYNQVLEIMPYHLDAWHDLIVLYTNNKSAEEMADLSLRLGDAMKYFPLPMHDLMTLLKEGITKAEEDPEAERNKATCRAQVVAAERQFLLEGTKSRTNGPADQNQKDVAEVMANYLLGNSSEVMADFSFDGTNAGKIVFGGTYTGVRYVYSLDGGSTWSDTFTTSAGDLTHALTADELALLNSTNDILIWLEGWPSENENQPTAEGAFRIDILAGTAVSGLEANDNEDRFFGNCTGYEYSLDGETWSELTNDIPFTSAQNVTVHKKATGRTMQGTDYTFKFTDNYSATRAYIPISRMTLAGCSSEETSTGDDAIHAIDGLLSTRWHTLWKGGDSQRYISIRVDKPTYFSGVDYTPIAGGGNGTLYSCSVYVSMDGVNWYFAASASGWGNNGNVKKITFPIPVYGQYVKVAGTSTVGGFASARAIELFEDTTIADKTIAGCVMNSAPSKTSYQQGETLSLEGISVFCVYTDGSKSSVPQTILTADVTLLQHLGTQEIHVSYLDMNVGSFTVEVTANTRTPTKLFIDSAPKKTDYFAGQALNLTGISVRAADSSGSWYPTDYTVSPDGALEEGTTEITVSYQGQTAVFPVTVDKAPDRIEITGMPSKTTYQIGESFDLTDLEITLYYQDESEKVLDSDKGEYTLDVFRFSALPGEKLIRASLTGLESEIFTHVPITVLSNLTQGSFLYDVLPSETEQYLCYLSGYTDATAETVSVPAYVEVNGISYQVIGVRTGAFDSAPQVKTLSLPGTIQHLEEGSLSALSSLSDLYLTGIADIDDLTIDDGSLPESTEGTIYMADESLSDDLSGVLEDYQGSPDFTLDLKSGDLLASDQIEVLQFTDPSRKIYELDETMDYSGMSLAAVLKNGITLPLGEHQYTVSGTENSTYGERSVSVSVKGTELGASFTVEVLKTAPFIKAHPQDQAWMSEDPVAQPLTVTVDGRQDNLRYTWYMSRDSAFSTEEDTVVGTDSNTYTPTETGYYYAVVCRFDSTSQQSRLTHSLSAHVRLETYPVSNQTSGTGFVSLEQAFANASDGDTIIVRRSISVGSTIETQKKLTLKGESGDVTVTRSNSFSSDIFKLTGGSLTVENIVFHGENRTTNAACFLMNGASELNLNDGVIIKNFRNNYYGCAVYMNDSSSAPVLNINGATVQDCTASKYGGGVFVHAKGKVTVTSGSFLRNSAGSLGGAICLNSKVADILTISGGLFEGNSSPYGGAILVGGPSQTSITGGTFKNNKASSMGTEICYYNGGTHSISGGTFTYSGTSPIAAKSDGSTYYSSIQVSVTGGTYSTVPPYIAENYKAYPQKGQYVVKPASSDIWVSDVITADGTLTLTFCEELSGSIVAAEYDGSGRMCRVTVNNAEAAANTAFKMPDADKVVFYCLDTDFVPIYSPFEWTDTAQ